LHMSPARQTETTALNRVILPNTKPLHRHQGIRANSQQSKVRKVHQHGPMPHACDRGGAAYAPGIGTASYCCSPGAAATCSFNRSLGGGDAVGSGGSKPSCCTRGVAPWTRIGGGCSLKPDIGVVADAYCTGDWPSAAYEAVSTFMTGKLGERGVCVYPGVLGAL